MQHSSNSTKSTIFARACTVALAITLYYLFAILTPAAAQTETSVESSAESFARAVKSFKDGDQESARKELINLEKAFPQDPTLLHNLGVVAAKNKNWGSALGLWRKGLAAHPTNDALSDAVDWARTKLPKTEIAREFDSWESIRSGLLLKASPAAVVAASGLLFLASGWLFLRWWGRRRRAIEEDLAMPTAPTAAIAISSLFLFLFSVAIALFIDRLDIRGTIVQQKTEVRSAPDPKATVLFEVFEGMEVIVQDSRTIGDQSWRQLTYPGGLSGWVPDKSVFTTVDSTERAF